MKISSDECRKRQNQQHLTLTNPSSLIPPPWYQNDNEGKQIHLWARMTPNLLKSRKSWQKVSNYWFTCPGFINYQTSQHSPSVEWGQHVFWVWLISVILQVMHGKRGSSKIGTDTGDNGDKRFEKRRIWKERKDSSGMSGEEQRSPRWIWRKGETYDVEKIIVEL